MYILRIANLSKKYPLDNGEYKTVLDNVSLMLPSSGLIAIVGKSGSGKSTLLNMISLLDKPTSGRVYFMNENTEKWKRKRIEKYRNEDIGIVFQNYNLLENETAIFNIMLPALIGGKSRKEAEFAAKLLLNELNIDEKLWYQKCRDLSGGEKERIAILRSLVNDPKIVLADEPTGALDSRNSILVMEIFKKISEKRLVVFVTHNNDLVKKYANQVITIKDGKIKNDENIGFVEDNSKEKQRKRLLKRNSWALSLTKGNFKRRFKRNQFSMIGLIIGLVSTFLILGFSTELILRVTQIK